MLSPFKDSLSRYETVYPLYEFLKLESKNSNIQKNETVLTIFAYTAIVFIQFHTNHRALSAHASSRCFVHRNAETVYSTFSHFL